MADFTNPSGVYIQYFPEEFASAGTPNNAVPGLFVGFAQRGRDNEIVFSGNANNLVKEFGTPDYRKHGFQLHNAYRFNLQSAATYFMRVLPVLEDVTNPLPSDTVYPFAATFANVVLTGLTSSSSKAPILMVPLTFSPKEFFDVTGGPSPYCQSVYTYETEAAELAHPGDAEFAFTKSVSFKVVYNDEQVDVVGAGYFAEDATLNIPYLNVRNKISLLGGYVTPQRDDYIDAFLSNLNVNKLTGYTGFKPARVVAQSNSLDLTNTSAEPGNTFIAVPVNGAINGIEHFLQEAHFTVRIDDNGHKHLDFSVSVPDGTEFYVIPLPYEEAAVLSTQEPLVIPNPKALWVAVPSDLRDTDGEYYRLVEGPDGYELYAATDATVVAYYYSPNLVDPEVPPQELKPSYVVDVFTDNITLLQKTSVLEYAYYVDKVGASTYAFPVIEVNGKALVPLKSEPTDITTLTRDSVYIDEENRIIRLYLVGDVGEIKNVRIYYVQGAPVTATVEAKLLYGFFGKGRGGWYNKLALQVTPQFELTSAGATPSGDLYSVGVMVYDSRIGDYTPVDRPYSVSILPDSTDYSGNPNDVGTVLNDNSAYVRVFVNKEVLTRLRQTPAINPAFGSLLEEVFYRTVQIFGSAWKFGGGADGLLRNYTDGSINWAVATSLLIKAFQGLYDPSIRSVNKYLFRVMYDAGYPDPVKFEIVKLASLRQDAFAILDPPLLFDLNSLLTWFDNLGLSTFFAGMWHTWVKVYEPFTYTKAYVPPSYIIADLLPYADANFGFWQPLANIKRAAIRDKIYAFAIPVDIDTHNGDLGRLEARQINVIGNLQGVNTLWGDYTLYKVPSPLTQMHAARTAIYIVDEIRRNVIFNTWDLGSPAEIKELTEKAKNICNSYMGRALEGYKINVQYTPYDEQKQQIYIDVALKPYKSLRYIYLRAYIS